MVPVVGMLVGWLAPVASLLLQSFGAVGDLQQWKLLSGVVGLAAGGRAANALGVVGGCGPARCAALLLLPLQILELQ